MKRNILLTAALLALPVFYTIAQPVSAQDAAPAAKPADAKGDETGVEGRVTKVTAYRGQALVTREVPVVAGTGLMEVIVSNLPPYAFPDSLFADGVEGLDVRAVRYRTRVIGKDIREGVQELHDGIEKLDARMRENGSLQDTVRKQSAYLDALEKFIAPTATMEMKNGVLNAEQIKTLTEFMFSKRETLAKQFQGLSETARAISKDRQLLEEKLAELGAGHSRTVREAVVFIDKHRTAASSLSLHYLVGAVNWRPVYNVRAESGREDVQVEYSALVSQATGEDWPAVALTLSTASPALVAQGADLMPLLVSLCPRGMSPDDQNRPVPASAAQYLDRWSNLRHAQLDAARAGAKKSRDFKDTATFAGDAAEVYRAQNAALTEELNGLAHEMQTMELKASDEMIRGVVRPTDSGVSVEYRLPGSIGLASRNDQQLVGIAEHKLKSDFAFIATPVLNDYVYLQSEIRNTSEHVLLEGTYSAYLDGSFVGKAAVPMVARGERFTVGFGIDSQLRVSRELLKKESIVRGGNVETASTYRLILQNYKDREVTVRLFDRIPQPKTPDLRLALKDPGEPLSTDKLYERDQKPKGILRWDVKLGKDAGGADAKTITYTFTLEHDKQMEVTAGGGCE